jgi:hypothetical protein
LLALPGLQAQQAARPVELKWGELAPLIGNRKVQIALPDGAVISGESIAVRDDALVLNVEKTSNKAAYPKGNAAIPRASVTLLQVERRRHKGARAIGTTVGVISGVMVGGYVAGKTASSTFGGFLATWTGLATAGSVGGYMIGKEIDTQMTYIKVVE